MTKITQLTIKEALEQGYENYFYDSDGFQSLKPISDLDMNFDRTDLVLVEKESYNPTGLSSKDIAEFLADHLQDNFTSETGDDTNAIYDTIKELDFSETEQKIDEALKKLNYYRSSGIKLIP